VSERLFGKNRLKFGKDFTDFVPDVESVVKHEGSLCASEKYRDGNIAVHVHLRIMPSVNEGDAAEYCAIFCKHGVIEQNLVNHSVLGFVEAGEARPLGRESIGDEPSGTSCCMQKPVLISIIDPIKPGEGMVKSLITSDVWLTPLDQCNIAIEQSSKSLPRTPVPPIVVVGDDKGSFLSYLVSSLDDQGGDHVIQNRSTLMRPLPDKDAPFKGRLSSQVKDILSALFIELTPNAASYGIDESANFIVELGEVLIRSLEPKTERLDSTIHECSMLYSKYGRQENGNTKDPQRLRDTSPQTQGCVRRTRKGGETHQTSSSPPPPEEVKSRTAPFHRRGDYTAKHIHSGSLEDV
jgi:hypothetical protein